MFKCEANVETTNANDPVQKEISPELKEMKTPVNSEDHNRTMVLQVDRTDLRLISPDRKVILLHKNSKDITACLQVCILHLHLKNRCSKTAVF